MVGPSGFWIATSSPVHMNWRFHNPVSG